MSRTKRMLEQMIEAGEYPPHLEVKIVNKKNLKEPPYNAECPCCGVHFQSETPIPIGVICPSCYMNSNCK